MRGWAALRIACRACKPETSRATIVRPPRRTSGIRVASRVRWARSIQRPVLSVALRDSAVVQTTAGPESVGCRTLNRGDPVGGDSPPHSEMGARWAAWALSRRRWGTESRAGATPSLDLSCPQPLASRASLRAASEAVEIKERLRARRPCCCCPALPLFPLIPGDILLSAQPASPF